MSPNPRADGGPGLAAAARADPAFGGHRDRRCGYRGAQLAAAGPGRERCQSGAATAAPRPRGRRPCQSRDKARRRSLGQVSELAEQLEERLFRAYGFHNELIQEKLRALTEVMQSLEEVQADLRRICGAVEAAYRDLCLQSEA
ncbi:synaptonemal complex central element protein 2 [Sylvia borin]